jgi:hypothetical protein
MSQQTLNEVLASGLKADGNSLSTLERAKVAWASIAERSSELATAKAGDLDIALGKTVSESYGEKALPKGWASILVAFGKFFLLTAPPKDSTRFTPLDVWRKMVTKGSSEIVEALIATATTQTAAWTALCAKAKSETTVTDLAKAQAYAKTFPRNISNLDVCFLVPRNEWSTEMEMVTKQMEVFIARTERHI